MSSNEDTKSIPHPGTLPATLAGLDRSYAILRSLIPRLVSFEDLVGLNLAKYTDAGLSGNAGGTTIINNPGGGTGGTPYVPDPTPAPTATGLTVTASIFHLLIEHDDPIYSEGHGHDRTVVFGAKWPSGDPTAPTFAEAVELFRFQGTVAAYPTETGTRWCIWIKWLTIDGFESTDPAGGTNGVQATTGKIGNVDLGPLIVEAANLASGAVTPAKLAVQIGGGNLAANSSFEADSNADGMADGWDAYVGGAGDGARVHAVSRPAKAPGVIGAVCQELKIISLTNAADSILTQITPEPVAALSPYVVSAHLSSNSAGAYMLVREFDSGGGELISHSAAPVGVGGWVRTSIQFTTQATCASIRTMFRGIDDANEYVRVDGVQIEPGDVMTAYAPRPDEILPGTITATEIGPEAVTTPKLAAYSVVSSKVAAQAIQTQHLLVTGRGALNADPEFKDPSAWDAFVVGERPEFVTIGYGPSGTTAIRSPAAGSRAWVNATDRIPVDSSKTYRVSCKAGLVHPTGSSPGVFYMGVALFDGAGASISGDGTQWFYAASGQTLTTTWAAFEGEFGAGTARTFPSNARYMAPLVILSYAASDSRMECQGLRIDEKVGFSLIVNGGILADHLAANSIAVGTAAIQNGAIVNAMIANAAIDDAKIGSLSAAKVTFGVMDGARINVNTLNGDRIIAGTISAGAMNVASLSAISANLGTVTAGTLSAGTTFAGALSAATGTFSGLLNAATGTFAGALNAATGTFSGALVAASGTFAGNLTAVGGTLGSLTINAGGHIKQGQTAYNTGTGFWLGEDGGVTKLSLGVAGGASLRWSGSGLFINNASFEAFSASLDAGDLSVSVSYARQTYGSRTVTASGGVAPYSYVWVLNGVGMGVSGATAATATFSGEGNGVTNSGRAICFVTDANGRVTLAHCLVTALHAELPGGE